ncbi:hypothetical protein [Clostridium magnum]|uniref:Uncharacterized protein n=1 Tax=Clostridium magnum DSM 2767 TaxID=1121326 RepID=A0A162QTF7_9CLOT|nr:hypothetical protein [Clostridium magnum]KZL88941.1 hypothetical protein CLMAG_58450 [Clostridium magnum DSM 2767]SHI54475.1 hypothetical protein SAMN02745944_04491 [Clostridium magnum DSM 2767]
MVGRIVESICTLLSRNKKVQLKIKYDSRETLKITDSIIMKFLSRGLVNIGDFKEVQHEEYHIHGYILNVNKANLEECLKLCRKFNLQIEA